MRPNRLLRWGFLASLTVPVSLAACSGGDITADAPFAGGESGEGGNGGNAGNGGTAGDAGSEASQGGGGNGGNAGNGGSAGSGGSGGSAGDASVDAEGGMPDASDDGSEAGSCASGTADCNGKSTDGCEVTLATDPLHCGDCATPCTAPANSTAKCAAGTCGFTCLQGSGDCNLDPSDGCEQDVAADPNNCGSCGTSCPGGSNGQAACVNGICFLACDTGHADCNGDPTDGCEADLKNDPARCGACSNNCNGSQCINGACSCASTTQTATQLPLDLYFMVDQSGSMSSTVSGGATRWSAVQNAITSFASDPASAGLGVAMGFFPDEGKSGGSCCKDSDCSGGMTCEGEIFFIGCIAKGTCWLAKDECAASTYATPKLGVTLLPNAAVAGAFANQGPTGDTPTLPAVQGAIQYMKSWATSHPTHKTAIVLATDGEPGDSCSPGSSVANVTTAVQGAYQASPSLPTFVVGVGSSLTNLNKIAQAGSGQNAFLVDTNGNAVQQFIAALKAIQGKLLGCDYAPPSPTMGTPDYSKVNVQTTVMSTPSLLSNVTDAAACGAGGGWYYDNPAAPTKITLCPATCNVVQADPNAKVDIQVGCPTKQ